MWWTAGKQPRLAELFVGCIRRIEVVGYLPRQAKAVSMHMQCYFGRVGRAAQRQLGVQTFDLLQNPKAWQDQIRLLSKPWHTFTVPVLSPCPLLHQSKITDL